MIRFIILEPDAKVAYSKTYSIISVVCRLVLLWIYNVLVRSLETKIVGFFFFEKNNNFYLLDLLLLIEDFIKNLIVEESCAFFILKEDTHGWKSGVVFEMIDKESVVLDSELLHL